MKCGVRVALGVAGGYFLGRTKKMKLAMMLGGVAAGRQAGGAGQLLRQGAKLLGESPEVGRLTDEIRDRLLDAAKVAAVAVATRQVEALTERVSRVGTPVEGAGKTVSDVSDTVGAVGETVGGVRRRRSGDEADSDEEHSEYDDEYDDEYDNEYEQEPSEEPEDLDESPDDTERAQTEADEDIEEEEAEEEEPAAAPRPAVRAGTGGRARNDRRGPRPVRRRRDG